MKSFTIENETNNITVHGTIAEAEAVANAERFRNEGGLAKIAADWSMARLVEIWNSLPGEIPVKKFKDRTTAVSRIWKAIQGLIATEPVSRPELESQAASALGDGQTFTDETPLGAPDGATDQTSTETVPEGEGELVVLQSEEPAVSANVTPQTPDVTLEEAPGEENATRTKKASKADTDGAPREGSKISQVIAMLKREGGTTLEEIMTAMQWQKHTTRAMLSAGGSLTRNHGLTILSEKVGEHRRYTIKA